MGFFKWRRPATAEPDLPESSADTEPAPPPDLAPVPTAEAEAEPSPKPSKAAMEDSLLSMINELVQPADSYLEARDEPPGQEEPETEEKEPAAAPPRLAPLPDLPPQPTDEELQQLRRLLFSREIDGLEGLHRHLSEPDRLAQGVSQVITEAIRLRVQRDSELIGVLKPTVDYILSNSVRNNPTELADNLFPVMGPAIRRSISEGIRGMLQEFSRTVEKSFSLTGLKWRLEALNTGKTFSEVVMMNTLEYQVEQVFVIHVETGTLLLHLVNQDVAASDDGDQIAAMLTAIQQFVNDSFARGELSTLQFGDRDIFVVRAPQIYLAAVVRGQAPPNLRIDMQTALELMVLECANDLERFSGDTNPFRKSSRHFEGLLISRFKDESQKLPWRAKLAPLLILALLLGPLIFLGHRYYQTTEMERRISEKSLLAPGLIFLQVKSRLFGLWEITCLKDDLAGRPDQALAEFGLPRDRYRITYIPYLSRDSQIVAQRAAMLLADKPAGVVERFDEASNTLTLAGTAPITWVLATYGRLLNLPGLMRVDIQGLSDPQNGVKAYLDDRKVLHLTGRASIGWREAIREQALRAPGITGIDLTGVLNDLDTAWMKTLVNKINETVILFPANKVQPLPEDGPKMEEAVTTLVTLEKLADSMDLAITLTIYGHADATGSTQYNYDLSQARAKALAALLYARGSSIPIATYGLGAEFAPDMAETAEAGQKKASDQSSRKIELRVHLNRRGAALAFD
ncbi:MAG: OmpA family protein [Candidatus Adiutrix sp.]|jgi:OOP family OmpA-OmpF porin|nr:OmpA family protein [Candidatus Adiutrix sp.]